MLRRVLARPMILSVALLSACPGSPSPSGLEQRNASPVPVSKDSPVTAPQGPSTPAGPTPAATRTPAPPTATPTAVATPTPSPDLAPGQLTAQPPEGTELFPVRLALADATAYQITTIGMVGFTGVKPSAFAREERLELDTCTGEAATRQCRVTHRYVHFEAEPPNGRIFEADEHKVHQLVTRHTLLSNGARVGATEVEGPAEQLTSKDGVALADVHRFFCIRFPDVPIGVGAKWKDTCHLRTGGAVDTREVIWELTRVSKDDKGRRRADFTYLGTYSAPGATTSRTGTVQGILYFFLDIGEPHLIKEQIVTRRDPTSQFQTVTTISYQFGKFVADKKARKGKPAKQIVVRTDGDPFPEAPPAPTGAATPPLLDPLATPATPEPTPTPSP